MTKQRRRKIILPSRPIGRSDTLYAQPIGATLVVGIIFIAFLAFGIGMLFQKEYGASLIPFSIAGMLAYGRLTDIQKVHIFEDTMYVEYLTSTKTYKAHEIETVEWEPVTVMRRRSYQSRLMLFIKMSNGKNIQIPPPGKYDLQKSLLKWRDKYQAPSADDEIVDN